ncbi:MAG: hypothetical protein CW342_01775 [Thermoactinomycetaceae bacterium]|nr:hypothetical protein [Bacillota bacterium]MBO2531621.1 hypothetical protein [Thermoactinomycetaceae bacterium]
MGKGFFIEPAASGDVRASRKSERGNEEALFLERRRTLRGCPRPTGSRFEHFSPIRQGMDTKYIYP